MPSTHVGGRKSRVHYSILLARVNVSVQGTFMPVYTRKRRTAQMYNMPVFLWIYTWAYASLCECMRRLFSGIMFANSTIVCQFPA